MIRILKRFWSCRVRGVHVFGKPYRTDVSPYWFKQCRYCPTVRAVRRRKGKG